MGKSQPAKTSVASGEVVVQSHVIERNNGLRSDVADAEPTGAGLGHRETSVAQQLVQQFQDVDVIEVVVHQVGVDVQVHVFLFNLQFDLHVSSARRLLTSGTTRR